MLGGKLVASWAVAPEISGFGLLSLFLLGGTLYVVLITLLLYRLTFRPLGQEQVGAAYWISVGASAITVLAGATLVTTLQQARVSLDLLAFVKGGSLLFWAVSTWWIPLVAVLRIWNHLKTKPAFTYAPTYWTMVFPLGMYVAATLRLSEVLPLPSLHPISSLRNLRGAAGVGAHLRGYALPSGNHLAHSSPRLTNDMPHESRLIQLMSLLLMKHSYLLRRSKPYCVAAIPMPLPRPAGLTA